ncbi:MAG: MFS transporter [bacterium]
MSAIAVHDPKLQRWRVRVFAATWLSYFGYYFCRKPFFITKGTLETQLGWDTEQLATLGVAFLGAYALGQFVASFVGDRVGPRLMLLVGMAVTIAANFAFGLTNNLGLFSALMIVNGLAQGSGWSGNVGSMAAWFTRRQRGTVMGFWATNFQLGGVAANALAAWALGKFGFQYAYFSGSVVLVTVWAFFLFNQRNRPEDVGLAPLDDPDEIPMEVDTKGRARWPRQVIANVALVGTFYFFMKFIRYALWSWAPYLLQRHYGLEGKEAGFLSTTFDLAGFAGVIALGVLSDRLFRGRRAGLSMVFVLGMAGACLALYALGSTSIAVFTICIGLIGFTLYGPDAILTSAGAIDVGSRAAATRAAGIINGMGSIGSVAQEVVLGKALKGGDVDLVFALLLGSALCAAFCLALLLRRNRAGRADM